MRRLLLSGCLSGLLLAFAAANAQAAVTVTINQPTEGNPRRFGHTLLVRVTVTSTDELSTVVATVAGRPLSLTFATPYWSGTIATSDLPYGATVLTVVATDVHGVSGQAQRHVFHDNPPVLEYLSPTPNALARPDVRAQAHCTDDGGPCQLRTVIGDAVVTGTGEIDRVVSLLAYDGQQINFTIVATDSAGQMTQAARPVWVETSPRLALVRTFPGPILDIDDARALVIDEFAPRRVVIVDRLSGATQPIYTETSDSVGSIRSGHLTPVGALVESFTTGDLGPTLHEWRSGALTAVAMLASTQSLRVVGDWAIYSVLDNSTQPLIRRRLSTGDDVTISATALNNGNDVTASGDVLYAESSGGFDYDLYRYSGGSVTPVVVGALNTAYYPATDGTLTAYSTSVSGSSAIALHTPLGEESLAVFAGAGSVDRNDYRVASGWTAWLAPGAGGSRQVWTRSPAGVRRQVSSTGGTGFLDTLNPQGDLMFRTASTGGVRRSLGFAAGGASLEVGSGLGRPVWVNGAWHVLIGPHLMLVQSYNGWTLSEGATGPFFDLDVAILNPTTASVTALLNFFKEDGTVVEGDRTIAAHSRITVHVDTEPGLSDTAVSTEVLTTGPALVVERTMTWDASGYGGHSGSAVGGPRMRWLFAEGAQGFFDTFFLLVNKNATPATVRLTYLVEGGSPIVRTVTAGASSRLTIYAGAVPELVNRSFSTVVESNVPIVAERSMYFGASPLWAGGHESAGVPDPATRWYHAEGATGPVFDTFILLGNPNSDPAAVTVTFLTDDGRTVTRPLTLAPLSRHTVPVDAITPLASASFATIVQSDLPIVSERAMYWSTTGGPWQEAHNSFGVTATAMKWASADGRVGGARGYQTYVLVANPSTTDTANLRVTFMREDGVQAERLLTLGPNRRLNVYCNDVPELANANFGVVVESTNAVPIAVERATYWDANGVTWAAGTNVTATPIP